ncbi:hypothetical protein LINPERHAP1_LOCUS13956 [Linum perenne]
MKEVGGLPGAPFRFERDRRSMERRVSNPEAVDGGNHAGLVGEEQSKGFGRDGALTLLQSVISGLPVYAMSCFKLSAEGPRFDSREIGGVWNEGFQTLKPMTAEIMLGSWERNKARALVATVIEAGSGMTTAVGLASTTEGP